MNDSDNPTMDGIARRTFLKGGALLGATALLAGGTGSVAAQEAPPVTTLESELEGPLASVDVASNTINVMGIQVDVSNASFASPTAALTIEDLVGDQLPGRTQSGFIGGTAIVTGTTTTGDEDYTVTASSVFVEVAENVILGEVTENTLTGPTFESGGSFRIQDVPVMPVGDPRLPFSASTVGLAIDMSTVDVGGLASPEGHYGNDGALYAHTLEIEGGGVELIDPEAVSITRVGCDDGGRLEIRGGSGIASTITVYDHNSGTALGTANAALDPESGVATYRFRRDISVCPMTVRVENSAGSTAIADVATGTPVPEEPPEEEPPEEPGEPTQTLVIGGSGPGTRSSYEFTVSGEISGESLTVEDFIDGSTATGAVGPGSDTYTFTGEILDFVLNGDATVTLDEEPYPIDQPLPNALTFEGQDRRADYTFTVSGEVVGASLTVEDEIDGQTVTGAVRRGQDTYYYSGEITSFEFIDGSALIVQNGQVVSDPTQSASAAAIRSAGGWLFP